MTGTGDMRDVLQAADAGIERAVEALEVVGAPAARHRRRLPRAPRPHRRDRLHRRHRRERARGCARSRSRGSRGSASCSTRSATRAAGERRISADGSAIEVWVVPTNEELEIARQVAALVG